MRPRKRIIALVPEESTRLAHMLCMQTWGYHVYPCADLKEALQATAACEADGLQVSVVVTEGADSESVRELSIAAPNSPLLAILGIREMDAPMIQAGASFVIRHGDALQLRLRHQVKIMAARKRGPQKKKAPMQERLEMAA